MQRSIEVTSLRPEGGSAEDFIQGFADIVERDPDLHAFQYEVLLESRRNREARKHADELYASYRSAARQGLRSIGIADGPLADLVFAALDGLVFQQIAVGSPKVTRDAVEALRRLLVAVRDGAPLAMAS